jgi:hypothetical protein
MKKLIVIIVLFFSCLGISFSQQVPVKKTKTVNTPAKTVVNKKAPLTKKDGTADMRFKANKEKAKTKTVTGPTKKDGTADMRYKANKKK